MNSINAAALFLSGVMRPLRGCCAHIARMAHKSRRGGAGDGASGDVIAEIIAPRGAKLDTLALENLAQSLTLSVREPVALELLGSARERRLLVRATTVRSLAHVCAQIRAHTPQAETRPVIPSLSPSRLRPALDQTSHLTHAVAGDPSTLSDDPLQPREAERVRAVELRPRAAAHLPLKLYEERELGAAGVDPLLGMFAAMDGLPPGVRVVAQLVLAPAPDTWSQTLQRLAVEHPLAQERAQEAARMAASRSPGHAGSPVAGLPLAPLLALLGLVVLAQQLRQRWPAHPDARWLLLVAVSVVTVIALGLLVLALGLRIRRRHAVYDMRLVEERTARAAARSRLTLFAIGPNSSDMIATAHATVEGAGAGAGADAEVHPAPTPTARASAAELDDALDRLVAAYRQHHLASGNGFTPHRLRPRRTRAALRHWSRLVRRSRFLLNARELAALWHVPAGDAEVPLLERTRARTLLAPALPLAAGYHLGMSRAGGHAVPVHLPDDVLCRNALLVAKTGKGKSNLLLHLACATLDTLSVHEHDDRIVAHPVSLAGRPRNAVTGFGRAAIPVHRQEGHAAAALAVVDPHGDLVNALLGLIPPARRDDVVLVDLADTAYPVALNPLDVQLGRDRDKAVENLLRIFATFWTKAWGTRMQNALEYALKTLYEANEALVAADPEGGPDRQFTLLDVASTLTAPSFRHAVLSTVTDDALLAWWTYYYEPLERRFQQEIINPVQTKMATFAGSRVARRIVGQGRSSLDLSEIVREGRILLVNTAKGTVGADTGALVGATLLGTLAATLEEQARHGDVAGRRRMRLLIDEFQTIPGMDYGAMLSELRKFGGTFVLSTQALGHLDALDRALRPTVLANVDALYAFATSAEDARVLVRELDDAVEIADLINLDDYSCYAKLTCGGRRLPVFSAALDPAPDGDPLAAQRIRARARERYARPVAEADALIAALAERSRPIATLRRRSARSSPEATSTVHEADDDEALQAGNGDHVAGAARNGMSAREPAPRAPRRRGRYGQRSPGSGPRGRAAEMSQPFPLWSAAGTAATANGETASSPKTAARGPGGDTGGATGATVQPAADSGTGAGEAERDKGSVTEEGAGG